MEQSRSDIIETQMSRYNKIEQEAIETLNKSDKFDLQFNLMNERLNNHVNKTAKNLSK